MEINKPNPKQQKNNQWDEQPLSSESQVTLCKFNSDLSQNDNNPNLNTLLQSFPIDQRKNFIIDKNRGVIVDSRNGKTVQDIPNSLASSGIFKKQFGRQSTSSVQSAKTHKMKTNSKHKFYSVPKRNAVSNTNITINNQDVWDDYWEQSEKLHQKLLMGICQKNDQLLNQLINRKSNSIPINLNYKSFDNWTPLHFAALHGNLYALDLLLSSPEIYINPFTGFKESPLHVAAKNNKAEAVQKLINTGVQVNSQDQDGNTALHHAAELGYKSVIEVLMKLSKNVINTQIKNNKGLTPRDLTSYPDILKLLNASNSKIMGVFSRGNRHIEKLLEKVQNSRKINPQQKQQLEMQKYKDIIPKLQKKDSGKNSTKPLSKKQNLVKMYQLLRQKKPTEKVTIQSFRFFKKIGEGAFGQVYIVKKNKSQKMYALKAIKKQRIIGTNLMRYIQTQKQVLSLIKHPFIVQLYYAFQTETNLFLVMEYCSGGDLGKFLQKKRKFDETTVKKYAAEILLALQALHKQKIIYRDLKPDNIVLDKDGHALLTDFGLSKKTTNLDDINKSFCGTPAYLPLEIINKKGHNRMADWYEYGVVIYQLLAGIPPFYAQTRQQLFQNVRTGIVRFPKGSSQAFRDLIKKLLAQNPQKRLGFVNDAQSIKQHRWFEDVNWQDVYSKKLQMPIVQNKVTIGQPIKTKFVQQKTQKYQVSGWSFIAS